jgi:hypothetical protein
METSEVLFQLQPSGQNSRLLDLQAFSSGKQQSAVLGAGQLQVLLLRLHDESGTAAGNQQQSLVSMPLLLVGQFSLPLSHQLKIHRQGDFDYLLQAQLTSAPNDFEDAKVLLYRLETGLYGKADQLEQLDHLLAHYCQYELTQYREQLAAVDERSGQIVCLFDNQSYRPVSTEDIVIEKQQEPLVIVEMNHNNHSLSKRAADKAVETTARISDAMISQAGKLGNSIKTGASALKSRINPNQEPVKISATVKQRAASISNYTKIAAQMTSTVARTAIAGAEMFGSYLGAALRSHRSTAPAMEKYQDVRYLLAQSIVAAANLARGVDQSVRLIACEAGQATIELAGWKYGDEVRQVMQHAVDSAGQVSLVYFDSKGLSRRVVVRLADEAIKPAIGTESTVGGAVAANKKIS